MSGVPERLWAANRAFYRRGWVGPARLLKAGNFLLHHCLLPFEAEVAEEVRLHHYGLGVVIHPQVTIGSRVRIYHGVTIAGETWLGSPHRVVIGSDVQLSAGCKIVPRSNTNWGRSSDRRERSRHARRAGMGSLGRGACPANRRRDRMAPACWPADSRRCQADCSCVHRLKRRSLLPFV